MNTQSINVKKRQFRNVHTFHYFPNVSSYTCDYIGAITIENRKSMQIYAADPETEWTVSISMAKAVVKVLITQSPNRASNTD